MSTFDMLVRLGYLAAATCFVLGLHLMNSPATARRGNQVSAAGMTLAILTTVVVLADDKSSTATAITVLVLGSAVGAVAGAVTARRIAMTAMPQLVSVLNAVGGGAAALIALAEAIDHDGSVPLAQVPVSTTLTTFLDLLIGGVTFEPGQQYLITATDGVVNYCGFSGPVSPELQALFDQAFPG